MTDLGLRNPDLGVRNRELSSKGGAWGVEGEDETRKRWWWWMENL